LLSVFAIWKINSLSLLLRGGRGKREGRGREKEGLPSPQYFGLELPLFVESGRAV